MSGKETSSAAVKGMHLSLFSLIAIAVSCVFAVLLFLMVWKAYDGYRTMRDSTDEYIACRQYAEDVVNASHYLTNEVRYFAVTGEIDHIKTILRN